jgi:tyrosinase
MTSLMTNLQTAGWYNLNTTKDKPPYSTISDYVYLLFSWKYPDYNSFATTAYDPVPDSNAVGWTSLEYLHNNLHNWIGGPAANQAGHMNDVPVAALDPIFWLHHG